MQTDITLEDAKTVWIGMGTEYADQNPAESEVRLNYAQAEIPGASERMVTDGTPLLKIMSCGNGRIGVLGIDLSEITGFVKRKSFLRGLVSRGGVPGGRTEQDLLLFLWPGWPATGMPRIL